MNNNISIWINTVAPFSFTEQMVEYLISECHITEIKELYCNDVVCSILDDCRFDLRPAFAEFWALSKNITLWDFLIGFGICSGIELDLKSIIDSKFNTLEKLSKVNYRQLINFGVEENIAKNFIENLDFSMNEMKAVLDTKRVIIK